MPNNTNKQNRKCIIWAFHLPIYQIFYKDENTKV